MGNRPGRCLYTTSGRMYYKVLTTAFMCIRLHLLHFKSTVQAPRYNRKTVHTSVSTMSFSSSLPTGNISFASPPSSSCHPHATQLSRRIPPQPDHLRRRRRLPVLHGTTRQAFQCPQSPLHAPRRRRGEPREPSSPSQSQSLLTPPPSPSDPSSSTACFSSSSAESTTLAP